MFKMKEDVNSSVELQSENYFYKKPGINQDIQ